MLDTLGTADREAPERGAAGEHRVSTERDRLDDVSTATNASVHQHHDAIGDRLDDFGQRVQRRGDPVELPTAVVRDDDPFNACLTSEFRVFRRENAFDEDR